MHYHSAYRLTKASFEGSGRIHVTNIQRWTFSIASPSRVHLLLRLGRMLVHRNSYKPDSRTHHGTRTKHIGPFKIHIVVPPFFGRVVRTHRSSPSMDLLRRHTSDRGMHVLRFERIDSRHPISSRFVFPIIRTTIFPGRIRTIRKDGSISTCSMISRLERHSNRRHGNETRRSTVINGMRLC